MCFIPFYLPNHIDEHCRSSYEAYRVAYRHGEPDTVQSPPFRQDGKQRDEEEHLTCDAQEDALACVPNALEEVADDHLSTH